MTFRELDTITLTRDVPEFGLVAGQEGVIVHLHAATVVEVEFFTAAGDTLLVAPVGTEILRPVSAHNGHGVTPRR